jgi:hypothetical protein
MDSNFTILKTELIRQKTEVSYNQVQFSATILNPVGDYLVNNQCPNTSWIQKGYSANPSFTTNISNISF